MSSMNKGSFISSTPFISFPFLLYYLKLPVQCQKHIGERGYPCLAPDLSRKALTSLPSSMMSAEGFL